MNRVLKLTMLLNRPGSTKFVKMAFSNFRKDYVKRIHQTVEIISHEIESQGQESPSKKNVSEINLQQAIKQV